MGAHREAPRGRRAGLQPAGEPHCGACAGDAGAAGGGEAQRRLGHLHGLPGAQVRHPREERPHLLGSHRAAD